MKRSDIMNKKILIVLEDSLMLLLYIFGILAIYTYENMFDIILAFIFISSALHIHDKKFIRKPKKGVKI